MFIFFSRYKIIAFISLSILVNYIFEGIYFIIVVEPVVIELSVVFPHINNLYAHCIFGC